MLREGFGSMPIEFIEKYGKYVVITGVRDVRILDPETVLLRLREFDEKMEVQILDVAGIAGIDHLRFAVLNALKAQAQGKQATGALAVEILLYASGQRQIKNAIAHLGVSRDSRHVAVVAVAGERAALERLVSELPNITMGRADESVLQEGDDATIRRIFGLSDDQMEAVAGKGSRKERMTKLVIEKMALLSVQA